MASHRDWGKQSLRGKPSCMLVWQTIGSAGEAGCACGWALCWSSARTPAESKSAAVKHVARVNFCIVYPLVRLAVAGWHSMRQVRRRKQSQRGEAVPYHGDLSG